MYKKIFTVCCLAFMASLICVHCAYAQSLPNPQVGTKARGTYLKAVILDSISNKPIEFATLSAKSLKDQNLVKYALSDAKGVTIIQGLRPGKWIVKFEYMGYEPKSMEINIIEGANDLKNFFVSEQVNALQGITITEHIDPMVVKKDTIEYNAAAYKINDSDMLEELLKKLPGVEIDSDGKITANGKVINKIMIDGKSFFLDDPQLATKNLPAKIVNKVKVVERKSDQARFTGIDDGEEETVIDLGLKPGMMNGWFGNVMGGYGTQDRFQTAGMVGRFTDKTQISLIANGNNTNNRGFTDMAGSMMGGARGGRMFGFASSGITTSWMGGVNLNTSVLDSKMNLTGSYMYSGTDKDVEEKKYKQTYMQDGKSLYNNEEGYESSSTYAHRASAEVDYSITDNTSILFRPNFNIGGGNFDTRNKFSTLMGSDSTNRGVSRNYGDNESQTAGGTFLFRQRLGKPGRTISFRAELNYSNNDLNGYNYSYTKYFEQDTIAVVDQQYKQKDKNYSLSGRLVYTEPLGRNYFLEAAYQYSYKKSNSDKYTYSKDLSGNYSKLDSLYSSSYENIFITQRADLSFMKRENKYDITLGASLQPSTTESYGRGRDTSYNVINISPSARFNYKFSDSKYLELRYRGRTNQPSINQLIPLLDNSNPLKITKGNPDLNPEFNQTLDMEYRTNNMVNQSWFSANLNGSYTTNKIISKVSYDDNGVQTTRPENDNTGIYSVGGRVMFNSRIAKSNFSVSSFTSINYGNGVNYTLVDRDYLKNITKNLSLSENLKFTFRNDFLETSLGARVLYRDAWYTVNTIEKNATWTNSITGLINVNIPGGFNITTDGEYTFYKGFDAAYGDPTMVWNAELSKTLFKQAATLKVKIYDILKQAKNTSRTSTDNYVQDVQNNTLGQYVMFSIVFRFGKFSGSDMRKMVPRGHGGPGGMRRM